MVRTNARYVLGHMEMKHRFYRMTFSIVCICLFSSIALSDQEQGTSAVQSQPPPTSKIALTEEEKAFIQAHPVIRFGTNYRWEPHVIRKDDGTTEGFDVDLIKHINERAGTNIQIVTGRWSEIVEQAKDLKIDGLSTSAASKEREPFFNFSKPYVSAFPAFVVTANSKLKIDGMDDLAGKSIAILKGNQFYLNLLGKYPSINVIALPSEVDAITLVVEGKADAAIVATTSYQNHYKKFGRHIKIGYVATDYPIDIVYSIRKDWPELVSIINKGLSSIPPETFNSIFSRWFGYFPQELMADKNKIPLTPQEQTWIKKHPEIRLGVARDWHPMEYVDKKGQYQGISSDYVRILNEKLGLNMKMVPNLSWRQVMDTVPKRGVDILPGVAKTLEREKHLSYTNPYLYIDWVIISRSDSSAISGLADLEGRLTSVDEGWASHERLKQQHPEIPLFPGKTTVDVLQSVLDRKAEAAIVEMNAATLIMHGYHMDSLKIDKHIFQKNDPISFAVRKDWPELVEILNKGFASIVPDERERIKQKWLAVPINIGFTKKDMLRIVLYVVAMMGIFLVFFLFWNRRLKKEVTGRIKTEKMLRESEEKYRSMMEAMSDSVYICSSDFHIAYMNPSMIKMIGHDATAELCHKALFDKDEQCPWCVHAGVQQGESAETEIVNPKNNRSYTVIHSPIFHEDGSISKMTIFRDTTVAKHLEAQLFRSERLSATGQLAATIAHEINSPLQGITSLLYSIERSHGQDEKLLEKLNLVTRGFTGIRNIVKKLLDLNRPGKEKKQPMNINSVIEDTVALLKNHLKTNNTKIVLNLLSKMPNITASPQQLGQVFMNLISNAVEAMDGTSKSKDVLKTRKSADREITVNSNLRKDNIIIKIADTGPGILKEDMEHIFDPFYTRKKEKGIGIGLSLCHGIIEDHKGSIAAKNSPEGGAIFQITLPIR
ncbi:MAG: transporter substrate-binding domain-containing protein [Desulfobacteraceae bacterium]|nr:transporter substrate-binding domain-containing protein [Desulfobacteraceae bacterium]